MPSYPCIHTGELSQGVLPEYSSVECKMRELSDLCATAVHPVCTWLGLGYGQELICDFVSSRLQALKNNKVDGYV